MTELSTHTRSELAHRASQSHFAPAVYYCPFADRAFSTVDHEDSRLAA